MHCNAAANRGRSVPGTDLRHPIVVLDDDPTGTQEVLDTPVVVDWSADVLQRISGPCVHIITNTRAYSGAEAYRITRDAAVAALDRFPEGLVLLRGDSTLRAHLVEEYGALRDVAFPDTTPPLLLVPALPSAGRVTIDGVHLLERDGVRIPLGKTEYAADGRLAYRNSRLLAWAEERSYGLFRAGDGFEVPLAELRRRGGAAVDEALCRAAVQAAPAVCAPDIETIDDLTEVADGLRTARARGLEVIVRCAPTFAAVVCGTRATEMLAVPRAESVLVVCGSYVPQTTRQLERLARSHPDSLVELDLALLLGDRRAGEVDRGVAAARQRLQAERLAVVATPRTRSVVADEPARAALVTEALAAITYRLSGDAGLIVFKGGITAAIGVREGLNSRLATVEGPIAPGVSVWRLESGKRCVVFPGNVGTVDALRQLIEQALARC